MNISNWLSELVPWQSTPLHLSGLQPLQKQFCQFGKYLLIIGISILIAFGLTGQASAMSCTNVEAGTLAREDGGSVCACKAVVDGKDYYQSVSGAGLPVPSTDLGIWGEVGGELAGDYGWVFDIGPVVYDAIADKVSGKQSSVDNSIAANVKVCSDKYCTNYITPTHYADGVRYFFENTVANGIKQVYSCNWYHNHTTRVYKFTDPQFESIGIIDISRPEIEIRYYSSYSADDKNGAVVPNKVTATDNIDPNPSISCNPSLSTKLNIGTHSITCTATDASGNKSNPLTFSTTIDKLEQSFYMAMPNSMRVGDTWSLTQDNLHVYESYNYETVVGSYAADGTVQGLPITLNASGSCSVSGATLTATGVGECSITASQKGNQYYKAAQSITSSITIKPALIPQTISFTPIDDKIYGDDIFLIEVTGGDSGNEVWLVGSGACYVTGSSGTYYGVIQKAGECGIFARQSGDGIYKNAEKTLIVNVAKADLALTFKTIVKGKTYGDEPFNVVAGDEARGIYAHNTYSELVLNGSGACNASGTTVSIISAGKCTLTVSVHPDSDRYNPASATLEFDVAKASQTLALPTISEIVNKQFTINAVATSGEPASFSSSNSSICSVDGTTVTVTGTGECVITAYQAGNENYEAATNVKLSLLLTEEGNVNVLTECSNEGIMGVPQNECEALLDFYRSTNGDNWTVNTNWNTNEPIHSWYGVGVNEGTVYEIRLNVTKNLVGEIPSTIDKLSNLTSFVLSNEPNLTGNIPSTIGNLTKLRDLDLSDNRMRGEIPSELGNLTNLTNLSLDGNELVGSIPTSLTKLLKLQSFFVSNNNLTGELPIFESPVLSAVAVANNHFTGDLPLQTYDNSRWLYLDFDGNQFTGIIPQLDSYNNINIAKFSYNAFSGATDNIPTNKDWDWEKTQTVPPTDISLQAVSTSSVKVTWTPIKYKSSNGYYQVQYATTAGEPYINAGKTSTTFDTEYTVEGLQRGTQYYFVVQTHFKTHNFNKNVLTSVASAEYSIVTSVLDQNIVFPLPANIAPAETLNLNATATSGLDISYTASGTCSVSGNTVTANSAGICTITAAQAGNALYNPATEISRSFDIAEIAKVAQQITFPPLADILFGSSPSEPKATTDSSLGIEYSASGACEINAGKITVNTIGTCSITAEQSGNSYYAAATPVVQSFAISKREQDISFDAITPKSYADGSFTVNATRAEASAAMIFGTTTPTICSVAGNLVTILQAGICTVTANQAEDDNYFAAPQALLDVIIKPELLTVGIDSFTLSEGDAMPNFTADYSGFVNGENESVLSGTLTFTTTATDTNTSGTFFISASGLSSPNYDIRYLDGTLIISGVGMKVSETVPQTSTMPMTYVAEGNVTDTIDVVLTGQPNGDATVTLTPGVSLDLGAGAGKAVTRSFNNSNWNTPQSVTITTPDDNLVEGVHYSYVMAELNGGKQYQGLTQTRVVVTIYDNDPGVMIGPASIDLTEDGNAKQYGLRLSTIPTKAISVELTPDTQLKTEQSIVTFPADMNALGMQFVNVSAVDDAIFESNHKGTVSHRISVGDDTDYTATLSISELTANISDNDAGVVVEPLTVNVTEGSATGTYDVRLNSVPTSPVTITVTPDSQVDVDKTSLNFAADASALKPQTVTVSAVDDSSIEDAHSGTVSHSIETGNGANGNYAAGVSIDSVTANISDNDNPAPPTPTEPTPTEPAPTEPTPTEPTPTEPTPTEPAPTEPTPTEPTPTEPAPTEPTPTEPTPTEPTPTPPAVNITPLTLAVSEGGVAAGYQVVLNSAITENVTVTPMADAQLQPFTALIFTSSNWSVAQTVTVQAVDDAIVESAHGSVISHSTTSADVTWQGLTVATVNVGISDNDSAAVPTVPTEPTEPTTPTDPISSPQRGTTTCSTDSTTLNGTCTASGQTLTSVELSANAVVSNAKFAGNSTSSGWVINAQILADAELNGGQLSGTIVNAGLIRNVSFHGASLSGGSLGGTVVNVSPVNGVIENVQLQAGTTLSGGQLGGTIQGDLQQPAVLSNVTILPGSHLSGVVLGDKVQLGEGVTFGPGVRFSPALLSQVSRQQGNLLSLLPALGNVSSTADLSADIRLDGDGILAAINQLLIVQSSGAQFQQDAASGSLWVSLDGIRFAVLAESLYRANTSGQPELDFTHGNGVLFSLANGLQLRAWPLLQGVSAWQTLLNELGLAAAQIGSFGQLSVPLDDNSTISLWPSLAATVTNAAPGLTVITADNGQPMLSWVFTMGGVNYEQLLFAAPAFPGDLLTHAESVQFGPDMRLQLRWNGQVYQGVLDYLVTTDVAQPFAINPIADVNGDGIADYEIRYPSGGRQVLFGGG